MRCRKCGAENPKGSRFCGSCGAPLEEVPQKSQEKKKKKRGWIFAVAAIAAAGVLTAVFLIVRDVREKQEYEKTMDSAEKYLEELDYKNAEAAYLKAIKVDPKKEKSYVALAKIYLEQGEADQAREILKTGQQNVPSEKTKKDENTISGLLDMVQDAISYSWVVEPSIEADDIYYTTLVDPADCSDNEQYLQKNSLYAIIRIGDRYGMIGMDGQMAAEAEYTEILNFADSIFLLWKDQEGWQQYSLDENTGKVGIAEGIGDGLNMNGFYYYAANRLRNENEALDYGYQFQLPKQAIPVQQTQKSKEFCEGAGDPMAWNRDLAESQYAVYYEDQLVTDFQFEECGSASDGLLAVKKDGKWGYVNSKGEMVIPAEYDASWPYFSRYDRGTQNFEENLEYCYAFSDGYVPVCKDGQWELKDTKGKSVILSGTFEAIRPVQDGKCWVKKDGKWGVIQLEAGKEDKSQEKEQSQEEDLHQAFSDATKGAFEIAFFYEDFDGDGVKEAYGITGTNDSSGIYSDVQIYFISSDGTVSPKLEETTTGYLTNGELLQAGDQLFLVWENSGGGSGSLSSIFGVREGKAYEPEISEKYMMFQPEGERYVGYVSDFSSGYHDYIAHNFAFDPNTGEFQEIQN